MPQGLFWSVATETETFAAVVAAHRVFGTLRLGKPPSPRINPKKQ